MQSAQSDLTPWTLTLQQSDSVTKMNSADITSDWGNILLRPSALIEEIKPTKEVFIRQDLALSCT